MKKLIMVFAAIAMVAIGFVACPQPAGNSVSCDKKNIITGTKYAVDSFTITVKVSGALATELPENVIKSVKVLGSKTGAAAKEPVSAESYTVAKVENKAEWTIKPKADFVLDELVAADGDTAKFVITVNKSTWKTAKTADVELKTGNIIKNRSLTIGDVTIDVTKDTAYTGAKEVKLTLKDDSIKADIAADTECAAWITNLPAGLTAKTKAKVDANSQSVTLVIAGTPTANAADYVNLAITIPADNLKSGTPLIAAENNKAKIKVNAAAPQAGN